MGDMTPDYLIRHLLMHNAENAAQYVRNSSSFESSSSNFYKISWIVDYNPKKFQLIIF